MQLTHLTILGFKSFADKTEIDFVPGLTGIVGPNGSGKSNITEAIRWALGEQSAKSLRGEKMGDVIFAGTAQRPALNRAEVTMTFDNSDGYLKNQPVTVTVCRRLYRDGESDFLINNRSVRLKDIIDLFMDSGLGKESFSFISQGRVEAIFNSKPKDRRGIIEEAAGVLKYKQQKEKAEQKLHETDDNLDRANDIVTELSRQVTPLAEQASLARDFERQNADYQAVHKSILALEIRQMGVEQTEVKAQHAATAETLTALGAKVSHLEQRSEALTAADSEYEAKLTALNDQLLSQSMRLENLNGEVKLTAERASNARATLAELKDQLGVAGKLEADQQAKAAALTKTAKEQATQQQELQRQQQAQAAGADPAALNRELDAAQTRYIALLQEQAETKNALTGTKKDAALAASQSAAATARQRELAAAVAAQREKVLAAKKAQDALTDAKTRALTARDAASVAEQTARAAYADEQERLSAASSIYQRTNARYETLQELRDDYAGFYAGVRAVLKHKDALPGVIGAVAELLAVPAKYQQALDVALGGSLQAVVTTTEQAAKQGITYLKRTAAGRATFLPTAVVRPRQLPASTLQALAGQPGYLGVGVDLVRFKDEVRPVMANLLGSLIVASTLDDGIRLANLTGHRYRIVSLDGDILAPGGALTGGQTKKSGASPLARTQEVAELHAHLREMTAALDKQRGVVAAKKQALADRQAAGEAAAAAFDEAQAALAAQAAQTAAADTALAQLTRQAQAAGLAETAAADYDAQLAKLEAQATAVAAAIEGQNATIADLKQRLGAASQTAAAAQAARSELATQLAVLKQAQDTTKAALAGAKDAAKDAAAQKAKLAERIAAITAAAETHTDLGADSAATIKSLTATIAGLRKSQDELTRAKAANREQLSNVSASITTAYTQQKAAMAASEQQSISLNRLKIHLDDHLTTLRETYQLSFEAALAATTAKVADLPMLKSRLKLLRRGLDELGPINPNAIAEYDAVKERYDFLTKQQDDLLEAKAMLQKTMGELDSEVASRFAAMFTATNQAFTEIFPRMFGGGSAQLSLTDPDDLLNTGIEISAQPPGKKLQRLSLLSGGERALTAIVLLFAILQVRPVPFSILDEVEASLDEVNVNRFGEFLRHYSSDTQFIVITHRRGTMLAANMLYGVTMQESGVSSMVAVSLDQLATDDATHKGD
ncbi:chromosome segregation protein SMC [Lacticaseibacillus kribbianus]|uniref:chromosome segregation protein SMC n=1 Tax=Lacticaseibacillus kribbianus TaxID=2926292 RepID=UPI001CD7BB43|nr:chromosome segregation protein SMC [Lacticaseibacillus kribbianus]